MAKIHVGKAWLKSRSLDEALAISKPGDELLIHEGTHRLESFDINGIHLTGVGDPARITVEGQVNVWAESRLSNFTLRASHFHNALYLRQRGARVDLTDVTVHAEPAGKYPAIYGEGCTVVMKSSTVRCSPEDRSIYLTARSHLHAVDSRFAGICLENSKAELGDVSATHIECHEGSKVESYHHLDVDPPEDRWALYLADEAVCTAVSVRLASSSSRACCRESYLKIDSLRAPEGGSLTVVKEGQSVIDSTSDSVKIHDPAAPPEPKIVHWRQADARSFSSVVAPDLNAGDTLQLDEGEYFLDDYSDSALGIACRVVGSGEKTIVHGKLFVLPDHDVSISHMTVRAPEGNNGVANISGRTLTMTDVVVEPTGTDYPPVLLTSGTTSMRDCRVAASSDSHVGVTTVRRGAALHAEESDLGWLWTDDRGRAELQNCAAQQLMATDGATVTSRGSLVVAANTCDERYVVAHGQSTVSLESLTTDAPYVEALADTSALDIGWLTTTDEAGTVTVVVNDSPRVDVEGPAVSIVEQATLEQATADADTTTGPPAPPRPARRGDSGQASHDGRERHEHEAAVDSTDPLAEIEALTGLTTVKQQIRKFTRMVQYNKLREQEGKPTTNLVMHSLFLGNPGTGKTTVARLLGQALHRAGAIPSDTFVEVTGRADLVGDTIGSSAKLTTAVLESALGGVLFIDEAYTLYKSDSNQFAEEAVDTILTFMENHREEIVVIFAGYGEQMQDLLGMNPGLRSRVTNRFDFEDFTPSEIAEIGYHELVAGDHTVDEPLYRRIVATEYGRTTDRSNGRWVRNFNQELITTLAERVLDSPGEVDISHVTAADLHAVTGGTSEDKEARVEELLAELDALIGLDPVKEWVRRLVNRVVVDSRRRERDGTSSRPTYHMVFAGNPGTGKTTVARIVAELFHNLGILATPTVQEVNRDQLIGQYIGHTEANTKRALDEAMGGVFFLDEAYELLGEEGSRDFGPKVISTLLPRLENDRDKFVAIFAGYSQQMTDFLAANPGLRSRVPQWIEFPDYSSEEVARIVVTRLARSWTFDEEHVAEVARRAYDETPAHDRSNGRWARIFVERLEDEHNDYVASHDIHGDDLDVIPAEVIDAMAPRPPD